MYLGSTTGGLKDFIFSSFLVDFDAELSFLAIIVKSFGKMLKESKHGPLFSTFSFNYYFI